MKNTHANLRDLIMYYGVAACKYYSCFSNISTGPFKGNPNGWTADKEEKREEMEAALKDCMDEIDNKYERKV